MEAVDLSMVSTAERNGELIAHLAAQCSRLRKAEMMRIGRLAPADQTGLRRHKIKVCFVARPPWFAESQLIFHNTAKFGVFCVVVCRLRGGTI